MYSAMSFPNPYRSGLDVAAIHVDHAITVRKKEMPCMHRPIVVVSTLCFKAMHIHRVKSAWAFSSK